MYCTLAQLKAYIGMESADDDEMLSEFILAAQKVIDARTRRVFECHEDTTRTFDALYDVDGRTLYLDKDLCAITTITNGDGSSITALQVVSEPRSSTPYYALTLKNSSGLVWTFEEDPQDAISVTGRWAYSIVPPPDIEQACKRLAAWMYRQKDSSADMDRPMVSADGATLMPSRLPSDVEEILRAYKRVVVR